MATQTVTISLPVELVQDLDRLAAATHKNRATLMEQALEFYLEPSSEGGDGMMPLIPQDTETEAYHLACIREGIRQADAGMLHPAEEVMARVRKRVADL